MTMSLDDYYRLSHPQPPPPGVPQPIPGPEVPRPNPAPEPPPVAPGTAPVNPPSAAPPGRTNPPPEGKIQPPPSPKPEPAPIKAIEPRPNPAPDSSGPGRLTPTSLIPVPPASTQSDNVVNQASSELNALVENIVKKYGISHQEALDTVKFYYGTQIQGGDIWTGSATINKYGDSLISLIRDNLPGKAFEDVRDKTPIVVERGEGTKDSAVFLLTPKQIAKADSLTAEERFEYLKSIGAYPGEYEWRGDDKTGGILNGAGVKIEEANLKAITSWEANLRQSDPEGYKVYLRAGKGEAGFNAYQDKWEQTFKEDDPQGFKVYKEAGGGSTGAEAYNNYVAKLNDVSREQQKIIDFISQTSLSVSPSEIQYAKDIAVLKPYEELTAEAREFLKYAPANEVEGILQNKTYAIDKFIREHPDQTSVDLLRRLKFPAATINMAKAYVTGVDLSLGEIYKNLVGNKTISGPLTALTDAMEKLGYYDATKLGKFDIKTNNWIKNGQYLTQQDIAKIEFDSLTNSQKRQVAGVYGQDIFKGNYFAEYTKIMGDVAQKGGILGGLAYGPILPVIQPIAKQSTLEEAKKILGSQFQNELSSLKNYVKADGSFDIERINNEFKTNPQLANKEILQSSGYENSKQLIDNLEYYNASTRVTAKEWATAALVGALDASMIFPAGEFIGGLTGKILGLVTGKAIPWTLAGLQFPDVIKVLRNSSASGVEKAIAGGGEALLVGLPVAGEALRSMQFLKTITRPDYTPLRSMAVESPTARVIFSESQLTKMKAAGVAEADIIKAGTKINQQLASGVKIARVELGPVKVAIKNVNYQMKVGNALFQGTPDVTLLDRGGSVPLNRDFFTAGKVAIEPMQRSYLSGQRATNPGIIEIRISDPEIIAKIGPQQRLISGKTTLEPEIQIPSLDELKGMGYHLEPIEGPAGRGVSFDAGLGQLQIRRFTLSKVVGEPTGLMQIKVGGTGNGGVVGLGDLHATDKFSPVFNEINKSYDSPVISGNPNNPNTWHWIKSANKGRTIVQLGDSIDRGTQYETWRRTFNRLSDEAKASGDKVERLLGNHELAYLSNDAIKGIVYTDAERAVIKKAILEDLASGKLKAAAAADNKLFTHAGVSKGVFKQYSNKTPEFIASDLNKKLINAVKYGKFNDGMFAKGRVERGNSLSPNERAQGGIFWLRPQEATPAQLDLGFEQVVGHNPGFAVRRIWGKNFIETDVGRRSGGTGVYADTPYIKTVPTSILTESLGGSAPELSSLVTKQLKLNAMRDKVADIFLGWDGRIYAIETLKNNTKAVKALVESIDKQIIERRAAGDSIGVKYLERQRDELIVPDGKDYIYGGIGFWRDIVMGRQNSVKVLGGTGSMDAASLAKSVGLINAVRSKITQMSDYDTSRLFGKNRVEINRLLNTENINRKDNRSYQQQVSQRLSALRDIVDDGLERNLASYLPREKVVSEYVNNLNERYSEISRNRDRDVYDLNTGRMSDRVPSERSPSERAPSERIPSQRSPSERTISERVPEQRPASTRTPQERTAGRIPSPFTPGRVPPPNNTDRTPPPPRGERIPPPPPPDGITPIPPQSKGSLSAKKKHPEWSPSDIKAASAFVMGELKIHGKMEPVIIARRPPYKVAEVFVGMDKVPLGMKISPNQASAYKSIQQIRGTAGAPIEYTGQQGFAKYTVKNPSNIPGKPGAIKFGGPEVSHENKPAPPNNISAPGMRAISKDNKTAGGFFLSTGAQEFNTPAGSMVPRPTYKRDIVPVPRKVITPDIIEVSHFNAGTLVRIDKAPVRPLDFANAKTVPEALARKIQNYATTNNGILYGSLNAYTKLENASQPHDIDLAFQSRAKAQKDIMKLAAGEGYQVKPGFPHSVKILNGGKWEEIADIDSIAHHKTLLPKGLSHQVLTKIDGIDTETLGEQYLRQSYGAVSGTRKAPQRAEHVKQAAADVKRMLQLAGAQSRGNRTHKAEINTHEHFRDSTKQMAKRLSGSNSKNMRNISSGNSGLFKTRVKGGSLISGTPIRGR